MLSRETALSARFSLEMVKPSGRGIIVGRMRHVGSAWSGRAGTVQDGMTVLVILLCVSVQVLIVRVSHFVLVIVWAFGVIVTVFVIAGMVIVLRLGTEVVVCMVDVA